MPILTESVKKDAWDHSYANRDNFLFQPHEEVIRFIARYLRKRVGIRHFEDVVENAKGQRILDAGCGIGRHVKYCREMGFDAYGFDFSSEAIGIARTWMKSEGMADVESHLLEHDARSLSFASGFFDHALSHGVLDSMPFEVAQQAVWNCIAS